MLYKAVELMIEKLHIYITIIAALAVNISCIITSNSLYTSVLYIIAAIVVFYIIGIFVRNFIVKNFYPKADETVSETENSDETEEAEAVEVSSENGEEQMI